LLILGLKFVGSLLNVIPSKAKNLFIPSSKLYGVFATHSLPGEPSYTITLSAKYVAIMKSCSTMNPAFLEFKMNLLMTLAAISLCSESRYADGSSIRYTSAGFPKATIKATLYNSPPDNY